MNTVPAPIKRSSQEWQDASPFIVQDPDGWNREDFAASWAEPITEDEFNNRAMLSTLTFDSNYLRKS